MPPLQEFEEGEDHEPYDWISGEVRQCCVKAGVVILEPHLVFRVGDHLFIDLADRLDSFRGSDRDRKSHACSF